MAARVVAYRRPVVLLLQLVADDRRAVAVDAPSPQLRTTEASAAVGQACRDVRKSATTTTTLV